MTQPIYLDHQATTPLDGLVLDAMMPFLTTEYGNPSSSHAFGRSAARAVATARHHVSALAGAASDGEIIFTSGATEADHLALRGAALATGMRRRHIVTTVIEHKAVLAACRYLEEAHGFTVSHIGVDEHGMVRPADVAAALTPETVLVSVMQANNEIGTLQPLAEIAALTAPRGILLHTDAAQSAGQGLLDVEALGIDLASLSAHKLYGPKGIGALYIRKGIRVAPLQTGGGQEYGLRAGTPNVPAIVGFGAAAQLVSSDAAPVNARVGALRDRLQERLLAGIPGTTVNGHPRQRLPGNLSLTLPRIEATDLLDRLPSVAASTGSACMTGDSRPSHVLTAIGLSQVEARATLRFGIGRGTTQIEIDQAAEQIIAAARALISAGA
ncbi:cysteine desulfurase family protein [Nonomuraea wenchangensis]